jgi:predicted YcjX-like family ATPase
MTSSIAPGWRRLVPIALASAGFAIVAIAGPAIAYADQDQDMRDYSDCTAQHGHDPVTQETCCILHNGTWTDVSGMHGCLFEAAAVQPVAPGHARIPGDLSNAPAVTMNPTKTPPATTRQVT